LTLIPEGTEICTWGCYGLGEHRVGVEGCHQAYDWTSPWEAGVCNCEGECVGGHDGWSEPEWSEPEWSEPEWSEPEWSEPEWVQTKGEDQVEETPQPDTPFATAAKSIPWLLPVPFKSYFPKFDPYRLQALK